jgi:subtilase family serine protease
MRSLKASSLLVLAGALLCSAGLLAQSSTAVPRITSQVDESSRTTLKGNVPSLARAEFDQGEADAATQLTHMRLVLSRSAAQQAALDSYLVQLQDKSSPNYHKWLTPQQFGALYGPADSDIAALVAWLQSHGLTLETISVGRTNIAFSGSVSQVEAAFHTSIHSYQTADAQFYSNTTDPQIPSALAGVVMGVAQLNTIRPKPHFHRGTPGHINAQTRRLEPANSIPANGPRTGLTGGAGTSSNPYVLYLVPGDAATIYDTPNSFNANFAGGTSYTGAGVNIAVGGDAIISASIVEGYRDTFLGTAYAANPPILNYCTSSTSCSSTPGSGYHASDAVEAYIDTELSGGMAPGATIYYFASTDLYTGIEAAIESGTPVDIFSLSFGNCEADMGTGSGDNAQFNQWWSEAAAAGVAVVVSTGDSGSAGCDETTNDRNKTVTEAAGGLQVSGFASTPYNIAVGGTDFYTLYTSNAVFESLVNTSNGIGLAGSPSYYRTALGYMPESTWNDSSFYDTTISANVPWTATSLSGDCGSVSCSSYANIVAGAGGASSIYTKPSWQSATGVPSDGKRDLPDVSLMAGNGYDDAVWLICDDSTGEAAFSPYANETLDCSNITGGYFDAYGGTSTSAPTFAGILALVEQKTGGKLGLPAQILYSLYGTAPTAFHDITVGNNSVACESTSLDCVEDAAGYYFESGYNTTTGYDLATGLGSVDATQLINNWTSTTGSDTATVAFTSVTPNPVVTTGSLTVDVTVTGSDGTPTGTVTLTGGSYNSGAQALSSGSYTFTNVPADDLAIGISDTLTANYSGSSTYATATASYKTLTVTGLTAAVTAVPSATTINSNQTVTVTGAVACTGTCTGSTTPTGTVTLTGGGYTSAATALVSGSYSITVPYNSLSAGSDLLTVTYSGNSTYDAGETGTTTVTVTYVAVLTPTVTVTPASTTLDSSQTLSVTVAVTGSGVTPTGTVTLSSGSYNSGAQTLGAGGCTAASCVITIPANSLNVGTDTLTANYSGDPVYAPGVGTASVTVTTSIFALAATTPAAIAPGGTATSTVTVSSSTFYTGTVTLTCVLTSPTSGTDLPTCSVTSGSPVTLTSGVPTGTGTAIATVSTTAASAALLYPKLPGKSRGLFGAGSGALLAMLLFLGIPARRRSWRSMLGVLVLMAALGSLAACGNGSTTTGPTNPGTSAGTYTFTVTGTGNPTVTPAPTTTFTVTVN